MTSISFCSQVGASQGGCDDKHDLPQMPHESRHFCYELATRMREKGTDDWAPPAGDQVLGE
jgi:hypothetical protein